MRFRRILVRALGVGILAAAAAGLSGCRSSEPPAAAGTAGYYRGPMKPIQKSLPANARPPGTPGPQPRKVGKGDLG